MIVIFLDIQHKFKTISVDFFLKHNIFNLGAMREPAESIKAHLGENTLLVQRPFNFETVTSKDAFNNIYSLLY